MPSPASSLSSTPYSTPQASPRRPPAYPDDEKKEEDVVVPPIISIDDLPTTDTANLKDRVLHTPPDPKKNHCCLYVSACALLVLALSVGAAHLMGRIDLNSWARAAKNYGLTHTGKHLYICLFTIVATSALIIAVRCAARLCKKSAG